MTADFIIKDKSVYFDEYLLKGVSPVDFDVVHISNNAYRYILKDAKGIWWFYNYSKKPKLKFLTPDADHFVVIDDDYAKDKEQVYLVAKTAISIPNADPESFMLFKDTPYFAKDKNQLYALSASNGLFIYKDVDVEHLLPIGRIAYITDKDNLYHFGPPITLVNESKYTDIYSGTVLEEPEGANDFEKTKNYILAKHPDVVGWWHPDYAYHIDIDPNAPIGYHQTNKAVYYIFKVAYPDKAGLRRNYARITKADVNSFQGISAFYAKDKNHVYYQDRIVAGADSSSFKALTDKLAKDATAIYYNGYKVVCDAASFEILLEKKNYYLGIIAKDKNAVFSDKYNLVGQVGLRTAADRMLCAAKNSDPNSFTVLSSLWAKDQNQVYHAVQPYTKADVASFTHLFTDGVQDWAKDQQHLYNGNGKRIVKNIDGASFKMLNKYWGKDANKVFCFKTQSIKPAIDAATFKVTDDQGGAADKDFVYSYQNGTIKKKKK